MQKQHIIAITVVAIALVAVVAGVILLNNDNGKPGNIDVTDARGRTVHLDAYPQEILAVNCCSLEILSYFDSLNKVVAIDKDDAIAPNKTYTQANKEFLSKLPTVDRANVESLIKLSPDVIITSTIDVAELDKLQADTGVPVFAINADIEFGEEGWFTQITSLGTLLNEKARAKEIVDGVKGFIDDIKKASASDIKGYTCGMMFYGQGTFLKVSGDWLPFIFSGVKNVMPPSTAGVGKQPYNTTIEEVIKQDIDVIFIDNSRAAAVLDEMKGYIETSGLDNDAIDDGEIYKVSLYKMWGTQFDNVLIDCFYVAKTVNPDAYSWTFEDKANEVLKLLYGDGFTYNDMVELGNGCGHMVI